MNGLRLWTRKIIAALARGGTRAALLASRVDYLPTRPLRILDVQRFSVLASVAARTVAAPGADPADLAHRVDDLLAIRTPEVRRDVLLVLLILDNVLAGWLLDHHVKPFTRLSPERQDWVLRRWRDSRIGLRRAGYHALRKLTLSVYWANPQHWSGAAYGGPPQIGQSG